VLAVTVQPADAGDTTTLYETLARTTAVLEELAEDPETADNADGERVGELVERARAHGMTALALTDTNALYGALPYWLTSSSWVTEWAGKV
jgi:hypothetical protein